MPNGVGNDEAIRRAAASLGAIFEVQILLNIWWRNAWVHALIRPHTSKIASGAKAHPFEKECADIFSTYLHVLGVPKSVGAIYGLLFASAGPLCFAQIVEKLGMSKGSVSQGLSFLRQSGAVKPVRIADDRREFFMPELGLRQLAIGLIKGQIQPLAQESRAAVTRMHQAAACAGSEQRNFQLGRIKQLETWHRQLGRVLPVVQVILKIPRP